MFHILSQRLKKAENIHMYKLKSEDFDTNPYFISSY